MARRLLWLAFFILLGHAVWRVAPVIWRYVEFQDKAGETVRFAGWATEKEIAARLFEQSIVLGAPVDRDAIEVRRAADHVYVDISYVERLEVLPNYYYPWQFQVTVDIWQPRGVNLPGAVDPSGKR